MFSSTETFFSLCFPLLSGRGLRADSNGKGSPDTDLVRPKYFSQLGACGDKAPCFSLAVIHREGWIHESEALLYITALLPPKCSVWAAQSRTESFVMQPCILILNCALRAVGQADTYEIFPLLTLATASAREIKPLSGEHATAACTHTHTHTHTHTDTASLWL